MPPKRQPKSRAAPKPKYEPAYISTALVVKGGLLKQSKPEVVNSLSVTFPDGTSKDFVHMTLNADWLCRVVSGEGRCGCPLSRVNLLDRMHKAAQDSVRPEDPAEEDPIRALNAEHEKPRAKKKARVVAARDRAVELTLPAVPPELDDDNDAVRVVTLWLRVGRKELWLDSKDVPWAIEFMHTQRSMGGVPRLKRKEATEDADASAEDGEGLSAQGSDASSKTVEWDWKASAWKASVEVGGRLVERVVKPRHLDPNELKDLGLGEAELLIGATYPRLRELAEALCHRWADKEALSP